MIDFDDFEITKREVLASISIIAVMILIGFLIAGKISNHQMDENEKYNKAVKIESRDLFQYGMDTDVGGAFVHGNLKAVDTVTYPEIKGKYMYVKKVKERYTKHTRRVAHTKTVNGKPKTYYTTETYWSWDYAGKEDLKCKEISFCGVTFKSDKIDLPCTSYIDTIKESSRIRYKYYGVKTKYTGTIFTELKDKTITDNSHFYENFTIDETVKLLVSNVDVILFWIAWVVFIGIVVFGFYYLDNRWLE